MKFLRSIFPALLLALTVSCSESDSTPKTMQIADAETLESAQIVSQKAYDRGYAVGRHISSMQMHSREREYALVEVHGMISALQRNGFKQTAIDFSKGVQDALNK